MFEAFEHVLQTIFLAIELKYLIMQLDFLHKIVKIFDLKCQNRDVPYGTTEDQEENRRKWKTPLEILYGGVLKKEERNDQTVKPSKKIKRQVRMKQGQKMVINNF